MESALDAGMVWRLDELSEGGRVCFAGFGSKGGLGGRIFTLWRRPSALKNYI